MRVLTAPAAFDDAQSVATLYGCRTQEDLERLLRAGLAAMLPGVPFALCVAGPGGVLQVRFTSGLDCPPPGAGISAALDWPPQLQLPIRFEQHQLGVLLVAEAPAEEVVARLRAVLVHYGAALANLVRTGELRQATDDYCASLQALEEGIVLFQETDPDAVKARLLTLATAMVGAKAGALYTLERIGSRESGLRLDLSCGIPEAVLGGFRDRDGGRWPDALLDGPVRVDRRDAGDDLAGMAPDCVPPALHNTIVLPLRYHGVEAGIILLLNAELEAQRIYERQSQMKTFGQLAAAVLHRLDLEAMRENSVMIARELQIAHDIQRNLIPKQAPDCPEIDFAWRSDAARSIGGDYLDFLIAPDRSLCAVIADASGHGINSALLMSSFRAQYRGLAPLRRPVELAVALNDEVIQEVGPTGMFITATMVRLDLETRRMQLVSAGHAPTMIWRAGTRSVELLASQGPPLGFLPGAGFECQETQLEPGDVLLLYTDGITEAADDGGEMFGETALSAILNRQAAGPAEELLATAFLELSRFTGRDRHDDDVSLLVIRAR